MGGRRGGAKLGRRELGVKWTEEVGNAASYTTLTSPPAGSGRIGKAASPKRVRALPDAVSPCPRLYF